MKIEISEISPAELLSLLDTQNPVDVAKLLIQALALQMDKIQMPELKKEVANELTDYCEDLVFDSDLVKTAIFDAGFNAEFPAAAANGRLLEKIKSEQSEPTDGDRADITRKYLQGE